MAPSPRAALAGKEVQQREQQDPDDVDEVPVQRGRLDGVVVRDGELAGDAAISTTLSMITPPKTWAPWNPVSVK